MFYKFKSGLGELNGDVVRLLQEVTCWRCLPAHPQVISWTTSIHAAKCDTRCCNEAVVSSVCPEYKSKSVAHCHYEAEVLFYPSVHFLKSSSVPHSMKIY